MVSKELDKRLLQVRMMFLFQTQYNISDSMFEQLDSQYHILKFLDDEYAVLHMTGDMGILEEIVAMLHTKGCTLV